MALLEKNSSRLRRRTYVHFLVVFILAGCLAGCVLPNSKVTARTDTTTTASAAATRSEALEYVGDEPELACRYPCQSLWSQKRVDKTLCNHGTTAESDQALSDISELNDLWDRLRRGFAIPAQENPRITVNLVSYSRDRAYLNRIAKRAGRYLHWITEAVEKQGMPSEIALLPVVESAFQPFAYSHRRAAGLWQFIPSTGRVFGLKQNWWYDGRRDIAASTQAALTYLNRLLGHFDGNWLLALAAYNSGQGTVEAAIRQNRRRGKPTDFWSLDLPQETRDYVPKLLAFAALVKDPETVGVELMTISNKPYMTRVEIDSQIDLALASELAGISLNEMYMLNPGFNRWATDPNGPHHLMLPVDNVESFRQNLEQLPQTARVKWQRHRVRRGETLLHIAARYHTNIGAIRRLNQIRGDMIRAGQNLIVPVSSRNLSSYTLSATQRLLHRQNKRRRDVALKMIHRVRRGDTLWDISHKFGVSMRRLAKWNGLVLRDTLRPGQQLVVWLKQTEVKRVAFSPGVSRLVHRKIYYRVRRGESLALIARKFRVTVKDLVRWNQIKRPSHLRPGDKLTLFVDVTQQTGI